MRTLELFCGTKSFSKVAYDLGHTVFTVDADPCFDATVTTDILKWQPGREQERLDVLWASPPCQGFSVAAIGHNWTGGKNAYIPKSDSARLGIKLVKRTFEIIKELRPKWWFIENPRGVLRKLLHITGGVRRVSVTYCQYGDKRMKPTDIWTNVPEEVWTPRPMCKNGDKRLTPPSGTRKLI